MRLRELRDSLHLARPGWTGRTKFAPTLPVHLPAGVRFPTAHSAGREPVTISRPTMSETDAPYTTDELSDEQISSLTLPNQIRYAIYNRNFRKGDIVSITTYSADWTSDMLDDMVADDELVKDTDHGGVFFRLPEDDRPQGVDEGKLDEVHEQALTEYEHSDLIGDSDDIAAVTSADSSADAEAHGRAEPEMASDDTLDPDEMPSHEDIERTKAEHGGMLPVDRGYDWEAEKLNPEHVDAYIESESEYEDIAREIEDRRVTEKLPHWRICGPTGCGKTSLGENFAVGMDAPCFIIECHDGLRPGNLVGMPTYVGDETWWQDGPLVKALLSSRKRPTVVIFDEVNRATSRALGVIMSFADHRAQLTLNGRGGETVKGDPMNLIVFATMNEGEGYTVNKLDRAQKRRFGNTIYTNYIGMHDVEEEAKLIEERTPLSDTVGTKMVEAANEIRTKAEGDSAVNMGVPTSAMLDWARTAWTYRDDDCDGGPLVKAAHRSIINNFYSTDENEKNVVVTTIESYLSDFPIDDEGEATTTDEETGETVEAEDTDSVEVSDDAWLMCKTCGWYEEAEEADEEVTATMMCPDCSDTIIPKEEL